VPVVPAVVCDGTASPGTGACSFCADGVGVVSELLEPPPHAVKEIDAASKI
jgi:hypothetical protein